MIKMTPEAQAYFRQLLENQPPGTGVRIEVLNVGTPQADVSLNFCPKGHERPDDHRVECDGFCLYVAAGSMQALDQAVIDFERNATGGELCIRAPGLRGRSPDADAPLHERIEWVLSAHVNPMLASHGGHVQLVEVTDGNDVVLRFGGGCHGCGMAGVTLRQGIEKQLREHIPEIGEIIDATDHDTGTNPYFKRA